MGVPIWGANMRGRLLPYLAAFIAAFLVWLGGAVLEAINPFLAWKYPALALFMGKSFPGGATPEMHYLNHIAETWLPFLVAFLLVRVLTKGRARAWGALLLYGSFLLRSLVMVWLDQQGVSLSAIFRVGLAGTFFGGAVLYLLLVDPQRPREDVPAS